MQKFARHLTTKEVKSAARKRKGLTVNTDRYDNDGSDYITVAGTFGGKQARLLYNCVNGRFFGETADGIKVDSSSEAHESEPWFQDMLNFFYVAAPLAVAS